MRRRVGCNRGLTIPALERVIIGWMLEGLDKVEAGQGEEEGEVLVIGGEVDKAEV